MSDKIWEIQNKINDSRFTIQEIADRLLENRGIRTPKQKEEFFNPTDPNKFSLKQLGIKDAEIKKAIQRLKQALENKEQILIYGDYDADGICATAILWETLYKLKFDVVPFIPNRIDDGYGLNAKSLKNLKKSSRSAGKSNLKLLITVDNGIVAHDGLKKARELGIDVIVTDHHQKDNKNLSVAAVVHTTLVCGSAVAWYFAREINKAFKSDTIPALELATIGTIADQMPLVGINRSIVKFGIISLQKTKRLGLKKIYESAAIEIDKIGVYEMGFLIAPRINAMGRLGDGMDSLRLLCTTSSIRAQDLALLMHSTNLKRQKIVDEAVVHAQNQVLTSTASGVLLICHETYHEGIIGLAASRLVEVYSRPAIVVSKGKSLSKGSARSIPGINIIQILRQMEDILIAVGGHEMAAGFSISNKNLPIFETKLEEITSKLIKPEMTTKKITIDTLIGFKQIDWDVASELMKFEPTGIGNPKPLFATKSVEVVDKKLIGAEKSHLKLKLRSELKIFDAIGFKMGDLFDQIENSIDIAYNIETNTWNGIESLQLKIRDIKLSN